VSARIIDTRTLVEPVEVTLKAAGQDERTETITTLDVHAFKGRDMRALDGLADDQAGSIALALAARITRQPIRVIEELGAADFTWLMGHVQDFLPAGPATGETGSGT
jgi:hypothetical protein